MHKFPKIVFIILVIFLSGLLFSPIISLVLPEKLRAHTYQRLVYRVIVDKQTAGCKNNEEKALRIFDYVVNHEFLQGTPYKCKPLDSLIWGEAYCDFQARTLNVLMGVAGIPSRYVMLFDKDGISPHTLNEVYLNGKWSVFDPTMNVIFRDKAGNFFSLEQISANPRLIYENPKFAALKKYDPVQYEQWINLYAMVLPLIANVQRSVPTLTQDHILDYITDIYFRAFRYAFFNMYQDLYLKLKERILDKGDLKLFYAARNYHLGYRTTLAETKYVFVLKDYPTTAYAQDVLFFGGILYFERSDFPRAKELFLTLVDNNSLKWNDAANYYLGLTYQAMGDNESAMKVFSNSSIYKLSAEILEKLNNQRGA